MKRLLLALLAIALFPGAVLSQVVGGRTQEGTIFFYGLVPGESYYLGYTGVPMTRRLIANECGVLKVGDSKTKKVADSYKVGNQTFSTWDAEFPVPPRCVQGQLRNSTPQSFFVTRTARDGSQFWDFYVLGLEPFSGHDVTYLENPTQYHSAKADRCGVVRYAKNSVTRNYSFASTDYVMLWNKDLVSQAFAVVSAPDLPVAFSPICKKGVLYSPR